MDFGFRGDREMRREGGADVGSDTEKTEPGRVSGRQVRRHKRGFLVKRSETPH